MVTKIEDQPSQITREMEAAGRRAIEEWREIDDTDALAVRVYMAMERARIGEPATTDAGSPA